MAKNVTTSGAGSFFTIYHDQASVPLGKNLQK
jgi:hypothetical protein